MHLSEMSKKHSFEGSSILEEPRTTAILQHPPTEEDVSEEPSSSNTVADDKDVAHTNTIDDTEGNGDSFDTSDENWTYGRHLEASLNCDREGDKRPPSAKMSVLFDNLRVVGAGSGATYQSSVGEAAMMPVNFIRNLISRRQEPEKTILHGIDGIVHAGEMLLVLGRPGSGCSTLLKNLAGFHEGYVRYEGDIKYNGVDIKTINQRFRADVAYNAEVETHFPHLSVGQTLNFAVDIRTAAAQRTRRSKRDYVRKNTDALATAFGLKHTLKTKVGDDFVRGISGGERKRVSLAEVLATRASVVYWDNPTRGLDASTAVELAQTLRSSTSVAETTAIVAAYQAGESFTRVFDKVTILYLGRQIFFGTLDGAQAHFESLGFLSNARQTTADFLTAITDPVGRRVREGWEHKSPRGPDDFARLWKESRYYAQLRQEVEVYNSENMDVEAELAKLEQLQFSQKAKHQRTTSPFTASIAQQFVVTIKRSYQRVLGDKVYLIAMIFSSVFMSLINGSVFVNTPSDTSGFFSKGGVIFFSVLFNALQTMSEVATQYAQRPIVQKHKGFAFYHPFVDSLSSITADWPVKFMTILIFDVILYFMVGLKKEAGPFFIFVLVTYLAALVMSAMFRTIAAATKQSETASGISGILVLVLTIYTGYVIPVPSMHPWFAWLRHINPVSYAFEALMVNEFHGQRGLCTALVPSGPGFESVNSNNQVCAVTGSKPGLPYVNGDDYLRASFGYEYSHMWRNIGILIAFCAFFVLACAVATECNPPPPPQGEFLVFRKGREPDYIKTALASGKVVDDIERGSDSEVLTGTRTRLSEFHDFVKSEDAFTWENISYDIILPDGTPRRLLDDVTGFVKPGTLTALMGESGAGKTTLLNVLARRVDTGTISGDRSVNGLPCPSSFQRRTGYVQQQDLHTAESTVREALRFSALLRQTSDAPIEEKYQYVERVIEMLEMEDYAEAVIGTPGNGLNVEQRKRTTIGIELVAKPALLLFLDEPTSGLDSQSAWSIVRVLRKLANSGQAILCTIHQPSSVLFEQFDRLLLLKKGGRTVYFGDIGKNGQEIIRYFEHTGAVKCEPEANPAEYILQVIGAGATAKVDRDWGNEWNKSTQARGAIEETHALKAEYKELARADLSHRAGEGRREFAAPWFTQFRAVQLRVLQIYWRNPNYIISKISLNVVAGLFLGFTFYQEDSSVQGMQNKVFAVFMACILAMPFMNQLQPQWEALCSLYSVREKPSKIYHWSTFVASNIFVEILYNIPSGTLFFFGWYYAIGFFHPFSTSSQNERGIYQWLMIMLFEMWWSTFGQAIAALSKNAQTASTFTTLFASFVIIFNGVLQPLHALSSFWHWTYYLSPYTWLISGLVSNVISGTDVTCSQAERSIFNPPSGQTCQQFAGSFVQMAGKLLNPDATADCEYCRYAVGDQYLKTVNMSFDDRWRNLGFMWAYVIFNASCAFTFFYLTKVARFDVRQLKGRFGKKIAVPKAE